MEEVKNIIRDIPDFPKEGIVFKDITPLLAHPRFFKKVIDALRDRYAGKQVHQVVGIEARGFIFAAS
ncbi:MAG: adenine phosphoribosyltransferase, partial [Nitrospinaceae bacterium]